MKHFSIAAAMATFCFSFGPVGICHAATPTASQALGLRPTQKGIEYDSPSAADRTKCAIKSVKFAKIKGWVVRDPAGVILRQFLDTNSDGVIDRWSYYMSGLEVYRDVDSNFNRKADQYRWLNTGGTRWGIDSNEDGKIDRWQIISAEEVTQEVIKALKNKDSKQFKRLMLTSREALTLGLGTKKLKLVQARLTEAESKFRQLATEQTKITTESRWANFGGSQPGIVPVGTDGSTKDVIVYENVVATVETNGHHDQVYIGTLVRVGHVWRLADIPRVLTGKAGELSGTGLFFRAPVPQLARTTQPKANNGISDKARQALAAIEKLDGEINAATSKKKRASLNNSRVKMLQDLVNSAKTTAEREQWLRQMADIISVAVQGGSFSGGQKQLQALLVQLKKQKAKSDLLAYVEFRFLTSNYSAELQAKDADYEKVQNDWIKVLEKFVTQYTHSPDTPEATLQLAIAQEFAGKENEAKDWYGKIVSAFAESNAAPKAAGAKRRLESVGKKMDLRGPSIDGSIVDIKNYQGKVVLIHYWATWCEPCKEDMQQIKSLQKKYAKDGFAAIGVNLDSQASTVKSYLKKSRIPWRHIHENGGLESRLANEMGILTLPTMILVDEKGKVINRNIHVSEIAGELKKRLR